MRKLIFIIIALISFSQAQTIQYIGAPTTTVINRGNFRTDSIFYLPKRTKTPTDTAAFRYQISDSSLYYWTGYQWTKVQSASSFASVDTTVISTRAYRQKGDDSLGAIIATKGSGTVTSVATGYGLSGGTITTTGTLIADTLNLSTRAWRQKGLDSLAALEISGTGTTNYVPKFTATSTIGNSQIFDNGTSVGVGLSTSTLPFEVSTGGAAGLKTVTRFGASGNGGAGRGSKFILGAPGSANSVDVAEFIVYQNSLSSTANDGVFALTTANSSGTLTERFRITNVGRFGLGTNNPQSLFHVSGNILSYTEVANTPSLFISANGTNNFQAGMGAGDYYVITSGGGLNGIGTERMRINSSGESLFGTTTDAGNYRVQVSGNMYVSDDISIRGTYSPVSATNRGNITLNGTASNIIAFANNSALRGYIFHTDSDFLFYNNTTGGRVGLYTEGTARLWIAANGSVGIGTTSPSYKLDVRTSAVNDVALLLTSAGGGSYLIFADGNTVTAPKIGGFGDQIFFQTSNTTRARINTSGNFLLGTSNNLARLTVQESSTTDVAHFSTVTSGSYLIFADGNTTSAPKLGAVTNSLAFITSGTEKARFHANGGLKYVPQSAAPTAEAGTVYYDSDDNKLKVYNGTTWVDLH